MTREGNSSRAAAVTWLTVGLAIVIPVAVLLGFMRGLTSVWRTKWEAPGRNAEPAYELGAQSRVSMLTGTPVAAAPTPSAEASIADAPAVTAVADAAPAAEAPAAAAVGLQIIAVTSPVERGATATVEAKAAPNAACRIEYRLPGSGNVSGAQGLDAKTADSEGRVAWTWSIGRGTTPGAGSVTVISGDETASATIEVV